MKNPRLEAMYRRLVRRHGPKKARRMIQNMKAQVEDVDLVDQMMEAKAREMSGEPPPPPDGVPEGSVFLFHVSDHVELWRIP